MRELTKHRLLGRYAAGRDRKQQDGIRSSPKKKRGKLSGQAVLLLYVHGLFAAGNALSGTFVNVYLWKTKNDFASIAWFAISHQITMAIVFWLAGKWVKEHNKMHALRLGVGVAAVFYSVVLLLGPNAVSYVVLLGFLQGISSGLFWLAFNVVYFEVTGPNNRDNFNGLAGLFGSCSGMIAPWISGYMITHMTDAAGYRLIFSISAAVFLIGVIVSFFLKKRKERGDYDWLYGFRKLAEPDTPWRKIGLALMAQGVREGVFGFLIGLLVYIVTKNEMKLGNFSLITSAVALVSFWLVGKWLKPKYRRIAMLIGVLMMIAVILPFFWKVNFSTLLFFGIGTSLFIPLFSIPVVSVVFDIIGHDEKSAAHRVEYIVLRELALNAGRFLGTLAFIVVLSWKSTPSTVNWLLLAIGSSPFFTWLFIRKWLGSTAVTNPVKTR